MADLYGHASANVMLGGGADGGDGAESVEAHSPLPYIVSMKHHHDPATTAMIFCNTVLGEGGDGDGGGGGGGDGGLWWW